MALVPKARKNLKIYITVFGQIRPKKFPQNFPKLGTFAE
jgi:hypothetical protein